MVYGDRLDYASLHEHEKEEREKRISGSEGCGDKDGWIEMSNDWITHRRTSSTSLLQFSMTSSGGSCGLLINWQPDYFQGN